MEPDIDNILAEQARVLPREVRQFIVSAEWEKHVDVISERLQLSPDNTSTLHMETILVLAGLVPLHEFRDALVEQLEGVDSATIDTIVAEIGVAVFAPIRPALEQFFADQEAYEAQSEKPIVEDEAVAESVPSPDEPATNIQSERVWEKAPDVAPDNLPVGEAEGIEETSAFPKLIPKTRPGDNESVATPHPFEEKMKKVFTSGGADISELSLPSIPGAQEAPRRIVNDPYREAI